MAKRTVWIAEEEDYDEVAGGWVCTGTFWVSLQTENELLEDVSGLSLDDALGWGRARAGRVLIRYGYSSYFSAGEEREANAPLWPPPELPELVRRRTPDE